MSAIFPFVYTEQHRRLDIQQALGGDVWWHGGRIHWLPDNHHTVIILDDPSRIEHERFDAAAWAERTHAEWRNRGVRI